MVASTMASLVHIWEIESGLLVSTADYGNERFDIYCVFGNHNN